MIYVFNKSKILSCILASCFVLMLFTFHESIVINRNVDLIKVSSNVIENNNINNLINNTENSN